MRKSTGTLSNVVDGGDGLDLNELIKSIDIVEYISQYVELTKKGDEWWGLSCFKNEKTPSFSVRKDPPFFYDYSSGIGGNLYSFIKAYKKCSGSAVVEEIKKYAGYNGEIVHKARSLPATIVCKQFSSKVETEKTSNPIVLPNDYMERYEKDNDKVGIWLNEGISMSSIERFQVRYDSFSNRLVYPIRNLAGNIVNVGGRILDPEWKEKSLRKYTYFFSWNGAMNVIYGLYDNLAYIKNKKEVVVFEGCKSVLLADTWGIKNTAAILTSHLSPYQFKILAELGCRVVFALDKDVDVKADKNIKKLSRYTDVEYILDTKGLLESKDSPVDRGELVYKTLYEHRLDF